MKKYLLMGVLAVVVVLVGLDLLPSVTDDESDGSPGDPIDPVMVVGSANFPENELLAKIYAGALASAGLDVQEALNLGSREVVFPAMERGDISVVPEYTGALLDYVSQGEARPAANTEEQVAQLADLLPEGMRLLEPSEAQDQETVTCTPDVVDRYSLTSLEDLGPVSGELVMGGPPELAQRAGRYSLPGLKEAYGIEFAEFRPLDVAGPLTVAALLSGEVDCANLFSTQSAIATNDFVSLADPKGIIESQAVTPLISTEADTPTVVDALNDVSQALTTTALREMVERIEVDKEDPGTVAEEFLADRGLGAAPHGR